MTTKQVFTTEEFDRALTEIATEQKARLAAIKKLNTLVKKKRKANQAKHLAAQLAFCRWIGENCYD